MALTPKQRAFLGATGILSKMMKLYRRGSSATKNVYGSKVGSIARQVGAEISPTIEKASSIAPGIAESAKQAEEHGKNVGNLVKRLFGGIEKGASTAAKRGSKSRNPLVVGVSSLLESGGKLTKEVGGEIVSEAAKAAGKTKQAQSLRTVSHVLSNIFAPAGRSAARTIRQRGAVSTLAPRSTLTGRAIERPLMERLHRRAVKIRQGISNKSTEALEATTKSAFEDLQKAKLGRQVARRPIIAKKKELLASQKAFLLDEVRAGKLTPEEMATKFVDYETRVLPEQLRNFLKQNIGVTGDSPTIGARLVEAQTKAKASAARAHALGYKGGSEINLGTTGAAVGGIAIVGGIATKKKWEKIKVEARQRERKRVETLLRDMAYEQAKATHPEWDEWQIMADAEARYRLNRQIASEREHQNALRDMLAQQAAFRERELQTQEQYLSRIGTIKSKAKQLGVIIKPRRKVTRKRSSRVH